MTLSGTLARCRWLRLAVGSILAAVLGFAGQSYADVSPSVRFICNDSNYPSWEKCYISVNGVTIRENGVETKGHLVGYYECIKGVCTNYLANKSYPYNCSMDDLPCFCTTVKPDCKTGWTRMSDSGPTLNAAVLPYARAVRVNDTATAFATVINSGNGAVTGCSISLPSGIPATFSYQITNASNVLVGSPNTPVDIPVGGTQSFVFGITPFLPLSSTEIGLVFKCTNTDPAPSVKGLNTLILTASHTLPPDLVAIGATPSNDGVVRLDSPNANGFFAAAAVNIGSGGTVTASADDGGKGLPVTLQLCETDTAGNRIACGNNLARSVSANQTIYYTVFVSGTGEPIKMDPANNRLFLRFSANGQTVGATNVALTTK